MLLLIEKHTDTVIEQTRSQPQETLEFELDEQKKTFSFSSPLNLSEKGKCLLAVTSFEPTNPVFEINDENNSFSDTTPGYWSSRGGAEIINKLQELLEMRHNSDVELHVEDFRKRGNQIKKRQRT